MASVMRFSLLLALLGALPLTASAEPITAALAATAFTVAGTAVSWGAVIATAFTVASSVYGSAQAKKQARAAAQRKFEEDVANLRDRTTSIVAADDPWPVIYGQPAPVGGSIKAVHWSGDKAQFKHILMVLASHECESIDDLLIDGESLQLDGAGWAQHPTYQLDFGIPREITYPFEVKAVEWQNPVSGVNTTTYAALVDTSADGLFRSPQITAIRGSGGQDLLNVLMLDSVVNVPGALHHRGFVLMGNESHVGLTGHVTVRVDGGGSAVHVSKHLSRNGVDFADPILMAAPGGVWTPAHKLTGYTYVVITINLLLERFQGGIPSFTARVKGKRVFDPRSGQTVYSRNPALCLADFIRSEAGYRALPEQIEQNALIAAANACDQVVYGSDAWSDTQTYGNDTRLYVCDGMFRSDQDRDTTRQQLEDAMAGYSLESGGVWRIQAGAWSTPVLALSDADMLSPVQVVQTSNPGTTRYNGARGVYVNQGRNGVGEDITPYVNATFRAADQKDKWLDLPLSFTASHARAHQLARTLVEQSRGGLILQINPKMSAWHLQPGDRIVISNELFGIVNKTFRVQDWSYSQTSPLALQVIEDEPSFYDLADETRADPAPNTNLPSPLLKPDPPFDFNVYSGVQEMVVQGGTAVVRVRASWARSNSAAVRMGGATRLQWRTVTPVSDWQTQDLPGDATEAYILGLAEHAAYQVRVRFQTPYTSSNWSLIEHTVIGKGGRPDDVNGLALGVAASGIEASWHQPTGLDLLDWSTTSLRIGATWELANEVFSAKATSANVGWLQAGTQRVWATHGSTSNEWSVPVSASIDILAPVQPVVTGIVWRNEIELAWQDCKTTQPLSLYELRRGPTFATSVEIGRTVDRAFVSTEATGTHMYWVRAVDAGGNTSAAGYVQLTVLPGIDEALAELEEGLQEQVDELVQGGQYNSQAITQEAATRAAADAAELAARTAADAAETTARGAAIAAEASARQTALVNEAQTRTQQITQVANSVTAEAAARAAADTTETNARIAAVTQEVADRQAAVTAEATTRAAAITAEQNARAAALLAETNGRNAAIAQEATTRQSADESLSSRITTLNASLSTAQAALQTEQTARVAGDAAEATARQQLATQLQAADATLTSAIASEATARSTGDAAEARTRESLTAALIGKKDVAADLSYVDGDSLDADFLAAEQEVWEPLALGMLGTGLIAEERQARITSDAAEVSARETLQAQLTGGYTGSDLGQIVSGLLFQEKTARATGDEALAQQITLISAGVGEQFDPAKIWYFDSGLEAWTGNGAPTASGGWLRPANHATDPYAVSPTGLASVGSTYSQVRLRIRKVGAPVWAGTIFWRAVADVGFDSGRSAAMTEPTYDGAGIGMVNVSPGWNVTVDQIRVDLSVAQTATDYFEIDWLAVGRPSPGASNAALQAEIAARANADSAEVTARENLATQLRGGYTGNDIAALSSGLLASERNARVSADAAEVTARQALAATVSTNKSTADAAMLAEQTARATADAAEVTAREALAATVANNNAAVNAAITAEQTARASADSAEVTARESLATQMRGAYAGTDVTAVTSGLIYSERQARITADNAEITARTALATTVTNNKSAADAAMVAEQTLRATADTANANAITALQATVTGNATAGAAAITEEANARAAADAAEATQRQGLSVALTGVPALSGSLETVLGDSLDADFLEGSQEVWEKPTGPTLASGLIYEERQARITADNAEVTARQALEAVVNTNKASAEAAMTAEQIARANADSAEVTARETLQAQIRGTYAGTDVAQVTSGLIYSERQARITADNAEVTARQQLAATVAGNKTAAEAAMTAEQTARANADTAEVTARQALSSKLTGLADPTNATLANLTSGLLFDERQARTTADAAEVTARQQLAATVASNKTAAEAAITAEQSARATADTANANAITALTSTVNHATTGLPSKATNTAVSALTTRVTNAEGLISSQGDAITSLNSSLELGRFDSQASLTSDENLANAAAWRSHYGTNLAPYFTTVADGQVATTVCRSAQGGASFWNYSKSKVVIDPARTYRITAWFRRVDANGTHYFTWWRNTLGNYGNSPVTLAALPNNTWVKLTLQLLGSSFGDASISPGFALNHTGGTAGYTEIQGFRFEDVTDALRITATENTKADATAVNALTTRVTSAEGTITAQANSMTSLTATVNGHTSSISTQATALAALDGTVKSQWRLKVDANGKVAGMIFNNNGTESDLVVLVDRFAIAQTGPGGTFTYPFIVGNIGGTPSVGINGNLFVDGAIKTRMIDADQIYGTHIKGDEIEGRHIKAKAITAGKIDVDDLTANISKLKVINAGQMTMKSDLTGGDWGFIRSSDAKWLDGNWGWIFANHPTQGVFVDMQMGGAGLKMHYSGTANVTDFRMWGPGFELNTGGLTISQVNVIDTLQIRGEAVTVNRYAQASNWMTLGYTYDGGIWVWGHNSRGSNVTIIVSAACTTPVIVRVRRNGVTIFEERISGSMVFEAASDGYADYEAVFAADANGQNGELRRRSMLILSTRR